MKLRHSQSLRVRNDTDVEDDHAVERRMPELMKYTSTMDTEGEGAVAPSLDVGVAMVEAHEKAPAVEADIWPRRARHL